ncbi:MAG: PAS domain-containing protein [Proteobacteria bacterium]|nr:PAS domain-containing protein [Pseudomonadota bacterium]MBI3495949.1 PAS domain-containing protein [Pseudomonadota bacterium]
MALPSVRWPFETQVVKEAHDYWLSKHVDNRLPSRSDIEPQEIPHLLSCLFLVDVAREPVSFRYRLVGTEIRRWANREFTGTAVNEKEYGPGWQSVFNAYLSAVHTRMPH